MISGGLASGFVEVKSRKGAKSMLAGVSELKHPVIPPCPYFRYHNKAARFTTGEVAPSMANKALQFTTHVHNI